MFIDLGFERWPVLGLSYVGERPSWPIQSPSKGRKKNCNV